MGSNLLDLPEGGCREFAQILQGETAACFAVRSGGRLYAYRNSCPHTGAPLNWLPDQFLTPEGDLIQCALHGALFRIEDGHCLHGPCAGQVLQAVSPEQG